MAYNKVSENLVDISLVYASLQEKHRKLSIIDSITWKRMLVQWANDFETVQAGTDWNQEGYLEEIGRLVRGKILDYAGLDE